MRARIISGCAALLVIVALSGCTAPAPTPTPTPTGFADDAAAFAAAEATYRAYVDAQNQVNLRDPATAEPMFALTVGDLNADDRKNISRLVADNLHKTGQVEVVWFRGTSHNLESGLTKARACTDLSSVVILDEQGVSKVSPTRPPKYALDLEFSGSPPTRISASVAVEDPACV